MELKISHSSPRVPTIIICRPCNASYHVNKLIPNKPTTKDIRSSNFPLKCSTNKLLIRSIGLHWESRFPKSLLFGQHKRNTIRAQAKLEFGGSNPVLDKHEPESAVPNSVFVKASRFGSICYKFIRPYAMIQVIIASICLFARVLVENPQLFKWSLLFKAIPGLIAIIHAHVYNFGINQIFDADIDRINKPYLPIPSEDLSLKQAWFLMIFSVLSGLLILRVMNADLITTSFYCFGILLATLYNAPPFRFKGSPVATIITIPLTTIINNIGVLYATMTSLRLPFWWSPQIIFITIFGTLFFAVTCIIKDISDVEGDMKHNIRTFAATFGSKNMALLGMGILLVNYIGAIGVAIFMPQAFKRRVMLSAHSISALWLLFQAKKLDKANYGKEASANFYQFIWKLLTLEFLLFPFI